MWSSEQGTLISMPATKTGLLKAQQHAKEIPEEVLKGHWKGYTERPKNGDCAHMDFERSVLARRFVQLQARF